MIDEKILRELKEINTTLKSIKTFTIAQAQLTKTQNMELKNLNRRYLESIQIKKGFWNWIKNLWRKND